MTKTLLPSPQTRSSTLPAATSRAPFENPGSSLVGVGYRAGHHRVLALAPIAAGTPLLELHGLYVDEPSRYSVQVAADLHVAPPEGLRPEEAPLAFVWRYLNHSCLPSARFEGRALVALRPLALWEEVCFDYTTTERRLASPFVCRCGHCDGRRIAGYDALNGAERRAIEPWIADHLRAPSANGAR